jgi:hypothetical protein
MAERASRSAKRASLGRHRYVAMPDCRQGPRPMQAAKAIMFDMTAPWGPDCGSMVSSARRSEDVVAWGFPLDGFRQSASVYPMFAVK